MYIWTVASIGLMSSKTFVKKDATKNKYKNDEKRMPSYTVNNSVGAGKFCEMSGNVTLSGVKNKNIKRWGKRNVTATTLC